MSYTGSMAGTFAQRHARATDAALKAAAQVVVNGLKDDKPLGLNQGYTSGDFVTGNNVNSIFMTEPLSGPGGTRIIFVATDVKYALYWEYGHVNLFTRKYERQERWYPTLLRTHEDAFKAYHRVYARFMS